MTTLTKASQQWATRPDDQRFTSLHDLLAHTKQYRRDSVENVTRSRLIEARPVIEDEKVKGLALVDSDGAASVPTHWAFGQLAERAAAPAGYLRRLPADLAADCINHGLYHRPTEDVGTYIHRPAGEVATLAAITGPRYGRVFNADIAQATVDRFGDGITGDFTVPGEFGKAVAVTKENTTLYASDRDIFIFLADEKNRIEIANRRDGQSGSLARGVFIWNSEVGAQTLGIGTFLFDYACSNRIVWGATGYQEIKIRHSSQAPHRFIEEVAPAIEAYANSSTQGITDAIAAAQSKRIGDEEEVKEFLIKRRRFSETQAKSINLAHLAEEGRPIETLWDATTAITAYAKGVGYQDARVKLERQAGEIIDLAR